MGPLLQVSFCVAINESAGTGVISWLVGMRRWGGGPVEGGKEWGVAFKAIDVIVGRILFLAGC